MGMNLNDLTTEQLSLLLNGLPLLSQAFLGPSEEWCEEMLRVAGTKELKNLGEIASQNDATHTMTSYIRKFNNFNSLNEKLEADYVRLFISTKGGITASLHHSFYESEDGRLMGRPAQMMASRLKARGLTLPGEGSVPPDHLAVEVEYLTLLLESALGDGNEDLLAAVRDFARSELRPWLEKLTQRLEMETDCPFYPATARLLLALISLMAD
jgi:TorA maturation chaperone TorD